MTSTLPTHPQTMIILGTVVLFTFLSIYLPWKKRASATIVISVGIMVVFVLQFLSSLGSLYDLPVIDAWSALSDRTVFEELGFYPRAIIDDYAVYQFLTSTYLHSGFWHILFNFLGLFFLGSQLEKRIGWQRFLMIYFGSGIIAGAVVLMLSPMDILGQSMETTSVGASGCIFGLLGGYWFLYPKDEIIFPLIIIRKWPVYIIFLIYGGFTALFLMFSQNDSVSHVAHFAGLVGAFPIAALVRRPPDKVKGERAKTPKKDLLSLARTKGQKDSLEKALSSDEPDVRDAWLDDFFKKLDCPKCRASNMVYTSGRAKCPKCGHTIRP